MPEKGIGHLRRCRLNWIAFNDRGALPGRIFDSSLQQQCRNTQAPVCSLDEQTGDGPDRLVIDGLENARTLKGNVLFARRDRAPANWLPAGICKNSGRRTASGNDFSEGGFVAVSTLGVPLFSRHSPEHAPTPAACATFPEQSFEVRPARGRSRAKLERQGV